METIVGITEEVFLVKPVIFAPSADPALSKPTRACGPTRHLFLSACGCGDYRTADGRWEGR